LHKRLMLNFNWEMDKKQAERFCPACFVQYLGK
jgi:hypothetical protein